MAERLTETRTLLRSFCRLLVSERLFGDELVEAAFGGTSRLDANTSEERIRAFRHLLDRWRRLAGRREPPEPFSDAALVASAGNPPSDAQAALLLSDVLNLRLADIEAILAPRTKSVMELVLEGRAQLPDSAGGSVIIVEDELLIALDLKSIVEGLGASVKGMASTAAEALQLVEEHRPDVVVVDYLLRNAETGIDLVEAVREVHDCATVFVTAFPEKVLQGAEEEPDVVLSKPYTSEGIRAAVAQGLSVPRTRLHRDPD